MRAGDGFGARQIGDGACHAQHPMIAARGQAHAFGSVREKFLTRRIGRGDAVQELAFGFGIGPKPRIRITFTLYVARFGYRRGDFPNAERLSDTGLALPFSSLMTEGAVDRVCAALRRAMRSRER